MIICPVLFAQETVFPYIFKDTQQDSGAYHSIDFRYCNLYKKKASNEPDGYADILSYRIGTSIKMGENYYYASYNKDQFTAKLTALKNESDRMELSILREELILSGKWQLLRYQINGDVMLGANPGLYIGQTRAGRTKFGSGLGIEMGSSDIDYDVNGIEGKIPFNWYKMTANCFLQKAGSSINLNYNSTIPAKPENGFDNKIFTNDLTLMYEQRVNQHITAKSYVNYIHSFAEFYYHNTQYAKLDNLQSYYGYLSMRYDTKKKLSYDVGCKLYFNRIGADSYFDIWPFTFWDMFLAHRTRIKATDLNNCLPYASISYEKEVNLRNAQLAIKASLEYNHLFHTADIIVKNRRIIMYPLIFAYDTDVYNLKTDIDGFFILPLRVSMHKWGIEAGISFEQLIPVDWDYFTKHHPSHGTTSSNGKKIRESGGTDIRFYLTLPTPDFT